MKNNEVLFEALGDVDEELVPVPDAVTDKKPRLRIIRGAAIAGVCAAAVLLAAVFLPAVIKNKPFVTPEPTALTDTDDSGILTGGVSSGASGSEYQLAAAVYPVCVPYPDESIAEDDREAYSAAYDEWHAERMKKLDQGRAYRDSFADFAKNSAGVFLSGAGNDNIVYSPLSLYMALGMTAEAADGDSRGQILTALGYEDIDSLRKAARSVWQSNYSDDGLAKCLLASSMWLRDGFSYRQATLDSIAGNYYASSFSGDPADSDYSLSLQDWLNEQTDGLLSDYVSDIELDPMTVLTLASTVNYCAKWQVRFDEEKTAPSVFHSPSGDVQCDFLNAERLTEYYWGDSFGSVSLSLNGSGEMRLILPDEGVSPEELLCDAQAMAYLTHCGSDDYANSRFVSVTLSVPKFDISSGADLEAGLIKLGITDIFSGADADFSPLSDSPEGIFVSQARQDNRVMIDEDGCRAVSLTYMMHSGAVYTDEHVDLILDRPFIFEIVSESGYPLFIGIVNDPA